MNLEQYNIIILDCDGVIFDSNNLKIEAFKNSLNEYNSKIVENFINYFKENFGTSRYNLTRVFIENFLEIKFSQNLYQKILENYGVECVKLYTQASFTTKCIDFIDFYKNKKLYVASGSDEVELNRVFEQRKIRGNFEKVYGSPISKTILVEKICKENEGKNIVMIGDAKSDYLATKDNNIDFIFMKDYSTSQDMKNNNSLTTIDNLGDLI